MMRLRLMKQPGLEPAWLAFQLTASIRVAGDWCPGEDVSDAGHVSFDRHPGFGSGGGPAGSRAPL